MNLLTPSDILDKNAYEQARAEFRRRVMVVKDKRREIGRAHV